MELTTLRRALEHAGPFVTVHADVSRDDEHGLDRLDAVCTTTRHALQHENVAPELIEEIERRLREPVELPGEVNRTLVAVDGEVVVDEICPGPSRWSETADVAPLPHVAPWLLSAPEPIRFVLVVADREGADVEVYDAPAPRPDERRELHGESRDLTKLPEGDWAQKQYQRRAENVWHGNAAMVADEVRTVCAQHRPRFVALAGDVRACGEIEQLLHDLPVRRVESGGRGAGASREALERDVERLVAEHAAHDLEDLLEQLDRGDAVGRGVAEELEPTLDALVRGQVDTLLIDPRRMHDTAVDPVQHPGLPMPAGAAGALPADDVLVAAAALTGARVEVLDGGASGRGVAALLRY